MTYRIINSRKEKVALLDDMVDCRNSICHAPISEIYKGLAGYVINLPVVWTLLELDKPIFGRSIEYVSKYGEWKHGYGNSGAHNELGMEYFIWANENTGLYDLKLEDSPDLSAKIGDHRMEGDIGTCKLIAFMNGIGSLGMHDLWISVLDNDTQVILEFNYYVGDFIATILYPNMGIDYDRVDRCFYCEEHNSYTITEKSRINLLKKLGHDSQAAAQMLLPLF